MCFTLLHNFFLLLKKIFKIVGNSTRFRYFDNTHQMHQEIFFNTYKNKKFIVVPNTLRRLLLLRHFPLMRYGYLFFQSPSLRSLAITFFPIYGFHLSTGLPLRLLPGRSHSNIRFGTCIPASLVHVRTIIVLYVPNFFVI